MSQFYLVQAIDPNHVPFIYEAPAFITVAYDGPIIEDIFNGQYDVGPLERVFLIDTEAMTIEDVTVRIAEAVRELVVASETEPLPVVRAWINKVGIDPIEIRDGH